MSRCMRLILTVLAIPLLFASCATTTRLKSSALDFLYPQGTPAVPPTDVRLRVPVRVGLAFAPGGGYQSDAFTENQKQELLERIAAAFRNREEIQSVEVIPTSYLSPKGGFENLDRLAAALGIQLAGLVSYDQIRFQESGSSSWTYWTLVGAYVVKGEKNEVRTILDMVVYDIPSRSMLFHASGEDVSAGKSTPAVASREMRKLGEAAFEGAAENLIANLEKALAAFKEQAATGTVRGPGTPGIALYDASGKPLPSGQPDTKGAGALGFGEAVAAALLVGAGLLARRRRSG